MTNRIRFISQNKTISTNRTSASQFEIMLEYFEDYPQMLTGKVDATFSKETKDKIWKVLASALNAEGNGPTKSIAGWRKTLKDWKCYVRKKASRREKLTELEEKLLTAIGEFPDHGQKSEEESPILGEVELDASIDTDVTDLQDICKYYGNRKAVKRRIKSSPAKVSEKPIRLQTETKESQRMVELAERKVTLLELQVDLLDRRAAAAERKAKAEEQSALLQAKTLHQQWRNHMHTLRMKKLEFL
ncbi:unnamed protein product [Larinioides sclopetarius]|uniref:Regulatory protein zeste n=1 Tax=Larinioides sclopetarius TaxID=280406 RepID=A0AAV2AQ15_9ARAC